VVEILARKGYSYISSNNQEHIFSNPFNGDVFVSTDFASVKKGENNWKELYNIEDLRKVV